MKDLLTGETALAVCWIGRTRFRFMEEDDEQLTYKGAVEWQVDVIATMYRLATG